MLKRMPGWPLIWRSRAALFSWGMDSGAQEDSLDISWLKDDSSIDAASLPKPEVLAQTAMDRLEGAFAGFAGFDEGFGVKPDCAILYSRFKNEITCHAVKTAGCFGVAKTA
ncbi:MAG: hypothetical protein R3E95_12830 [Thiolinea sp.]